MSIKKYVIKILIILIILIINMMFVQKNNVLATDFIKEGKDFLIVGEDEYNVVNKEALQGTSKSIFKVLLSIAICISVIIGAVLGFQFILGSVEGKAKVSEALVPYIVGCVIVFGAFTIWEMAVNIGNSAEGAITAGSKKEEIDEEYKEEIREEYYSWENWYKNVMNSGNNAYGESSLWNADQWKDFYDWMIGKYEVEVTNLRTICERLVPEYIKAQEAEKEKDKELRFNNWLDNVKKAMNNNPNMPNEVQEWTDEEWHDFYDWMFSNGNIYYPNGGDQFYKQLNSYINTQLGKEDDEGKDDTIVEVPIISIEEQQFESWYNSVISHLNMIEQEEAKKWDKEQWNKFYLYLRDTLHLQYEDIPSPGSDFNRYLSNYIKTLR